MSDHAARTSVLELLNGRQILASRVSYQLTPDWEQGRTIFGGILSALAAQAMRDVCGADWPLRALQTNFVGPVSSGMVHVDMNAKRALAILIEGAHLLDAGPFHQADHIGGGKNHRHFRESVAVGKQRRHGVSRLNRHAEPGAVAGFQPGLHFLASIAFSSPGRTYFAPSHGDRKSNWRYSCTSFTGS